MTGSVTRCEFYTACMCTMSTRAKPIRSQSKTVSSSFFPRVDSVRSLCHGGHAHEISSQRIFLLFEQTSTHTQRFLHYNNAPLSNSCGGPYRWLYVSPWRACCQIPHAEPRLAVACGKTSVAKLLREKGFIVMDADKIGHDV